MPTPLTNAPTPRPPEERRRKSRTLVQRSVKIHLAGERSDDLIDAQLVDLSASGVGIRMTRPLAPGKEFTLAVSGAQDGLAELHYRSVRCIPLGRGEFHIGAIFVRTPHRVSH
jgi:hypothetical protein